MTISPPSLLEENGDLVCRFDIDRAGVGGSLRFRVEEEHASLVSDLSDAALVALLIPAMSTGESMHLGGRVSERLMFNLNRLQTVLRIVLPNLRKIDVSSASIECSGSRASGVATGFSAGIDSYAVLADYFFQARHDGYKVTHLLFNNVGAHWAGGESLFERRYARLRPVADRMALPLVKVNSNVDQFYEGFTFELTHTFRNASVGLLLQRGIGTFLYASGYGYGSAFIGPADSSNYSESATLPLMSTATLDAQSVGSEYTRVEKTLRLVDITETHDTLDVCWFDHPGPSVNCSNCDKCLRTMATLDLSGRLELYRDSFDTSTYLSRRDAFLADLLGSNDPLAREIVEYAGSIGFEFPASAIVKHRHRQRHKWHPVRIARGVSAKIRSLTR